MFDNVGVRRLSLDKVARERLEKVTFELRSEYADGYLDVKHSTQKKQKGKGLKHKSLVYQSTITIIVELLGVFGSILLIFNLALCFHFVLF